MSEIETAEADWLDYAQWVGRAVRLMRSEPGKKIGLFDSSVPEPVDLIADVVRDSFAQGAPDSYASVFMRNHPDLEEQLANRYAVPTSSVLCTTGATMAVDYVFRALCNAGDHVLIEHPGFDIFANAAISNGLEFSFFERTAPDFAISEEAVLAGLQPTTRIVVLTNLHNPSGVRADQATLKSLAATLGERGICLLIDEVYSDYAPTGCPGLSVTDFPNIVRIGSLTKMFGLSTLRCGWVFCGEMFRARISAKLRQSDFAVSKLSHAIASEVFARADQFDAWRDDIIRVSRPVASARLIEMQKAGLITLDTKLESCVCFPGVPGVSDTRALSRWLTENHHVIVVPGECFGQPGHIRVGFAQPQPVLEEGLKRLATGLAEYRETMARRQKIA